MAKVTTDHEEIRKWVEKLGGAPELIDHKDAQHDQIGIRINFPGAQDDVYHSDANPPRKISWEEFFKIFDEHGLGFEYDDDEKVLNLAYRFTNR